MRISCAVWDTTSIFSIHCKPVTCLLVHSGSACEIGKVVKCDTNMLYLSGVFFIQQINVKLRLSSLGLLDWKIETENQSSDVISCDVAVPLASIANFFYLKMKRVLGVYVHVLSTCKSSRTSGHCSCWFLPYCWHLPTLLMSCFRFLSLISLPSLLVPSLTAMSAPAAATRLSRWWC